MAEQFPCLQDKHIEFIRAQHLFFVGTAASDSRINVSPKGMDTFRVLGASRVVWLNLTGSGNETAAHVLDNGRMTVMFCSFDKQPLILRLYGKANVLHAFDDEWDEMAGLFPEFTGARQVFDLEIEMVQSSCGYAIPFYEMQGNRETLTKWADNKGRAEIETYWKEKNHTSIDGLATGIRNE